MMHLDMLDIGNWDRKATRKRVEQTLERVRLYKQIGMMRREMRTTVVYEARTGSTPYRTSRPTERTAVWNADKETALRQLREDVEAAIDKLEEQEKEIIERRYLGRNRELDYMICQEMGMSERTYRRIKSGALFKLAWMLHLEVAE